MENVANDTAQTGAKRLIELANKVGHWCADVCADQGPEFPLQGPDGLNRGRDVQHPPVLAEMLSKECEPVPDMRDLRLLFGELEATFGSVIAKGKSAEDV